MVFLLLSACTTNEIKTPISQKTEIKISCTSPDDSQTINALDIFKDKINYLSNGELNAQYDISINPIKDIKDGKANIAIVKTTDLIEYGDDFQMFISPFFFKNPLQSTMTLNSQDFKDIFGQYFIDKTDCKLLSSAYYSSEFIASNNEYLSTTADFEKKEVILPSNDEMAIDIFTKFASEITQFNVDEYNEKLTEQENMIFKFGLNEQNNITVSSEKNSVYIIDSPIYINSQWILINDELWNKIDKKNQKIIMQGVSYLNASLEEERLEIYNEFFYRPCFANNLNPVLAEGNSIRSSTQSYIKFCENFLKRWDMEKYNEVNLIIK